MKRQCTKNDHAALLSGQGHSCLDIAIGCHRRIATILVSLVPFACKWVSLSLPPCFNSTPHISNACPPAVVSRWPHVSKGLDNLPKVTHWNVADPGYAPDLSISKACFGHFMNSCDFTAMWFIYGPRAHRAGLGFRRTPPLSIWLVSRPSEIYGFLICSSDCLNADASLL